MAAETVDGVVCDDTGGVTVVVAIAVIGNVPLVVATVVTAKTYNQPIMFSVFLSAGAR